MKSKVALNFVNAINSHDIDRIYSVMAEDFLFIGAYGDEVHGRDNMRKGWIGYFEWFPDYKIEISDVLYQNSMIALFGFASGTYHGIQTDDNRNHWRLPAAWKVIVENRQIKLWQVYCDSKIPCETMDTTDKLSVEQLIP